ncbi:MAG TPA: 30S ribosomal protein S3 [Spirochaetia bacterium]|jgi:small subunit ribosomal protein S3|nr:30S ribosomal protein S3 [Spirochaetia bacterium]
MGQKVNPIGLRLGINKTWSSRWFVDPKLYAATLHEDLRLRKTILDVEETKGADIAEVEIIRHPQRVTVIIHTGRPGVLIGAKGANIEKLGAKLQKSIGKKIQLRIKEIKRPETNAKLVAENVARQIKARASYRRACKMAILNSMKAGVQGIKVKISGRLSGAEMARREEFKEGRIPLHTFRADIDYGTATAITTFGCVGIKVWIFNGEVYGQAKKDDAGLLVRRGREGRDDRDGRDRDGRDRDGRDRGRDRGQE